MENLRLLESKAIPEGKSSSKAVKNKKVKNTTTGKKRQKQAIHNDSAAKPFSNEDGFRKKENGQTAGTRKKKRPAESVGAKKKKRPATNEGAKKKQRPAAMEMQQKRKRPASSGAQPKKRSAAAIEDVRNKKRPTAKNGVKKRRIEDDADYRELPKSPAKKVLSLVWDILFYVFLFLIIGGAVFFNFNDSPDKSFFGYRFMTVLTDSMAPNPDKPDLDDGFRSGSVIIIQKAEPEKLKAGDIITFYPVEGNTEAFLTHRIIDVASEMDGEEGLFITTQGDANTGSDIPIKGSQVVGKVVFSIPFVGTFIDFIRDNLVVVAIFIATLFGFLITLKYYFSMNDYQKVQKKKKRKRPTSG